MFDQLGLDLADVLAPWIAILISLSAVFWFKDFATNLMSGLKFKFNPAFNEGDHIILDDHDAIIVKIGLRESVFGVYKDKGYVWRFIPNDRLKFHKLEKIRQQSRKRAKTTRNDRQGTNRKNKRKRTTYKRIKKWKKKIKQ